MKYSLFLIIFLLFLSCNKTNQTNTNEAILTPSPSNLPFDISPFSFGYQIEYNANNSAEITFWQLSQIETFESNRNLVQETLLIPYKNAELMSKLNVTFGNPLEILIKTRPNIYVPDEIVEMLEYRYNNITYYINHFPDKPELYYLSGIDITGKIGIAIIDDLFGMSIEDIEDKFGKDKYAEAGYSFLNPLNPENLFEYGIKGYYQNNRIYKIDFFMLW